MHYSACRWQNHELVLVEKLVRLFSSNYWQNPQITGVVHYFQKQEPELFFKIGVFTPVLESVFNKVVGLRACNFIRKKLQHRCFPLKFATFLGTPILKNICVWLLLYFHYNSHHHYHYHHFQYDCKMHLYRLRILLTILLDCNMILCLFQLNFLLFLTAYSFL